MLHSEKHHTIILSSVHIGGAETQALNLATGLKLMNFKNVSFIILANGNEGPLLDKLAKLDFHFEVIEFSNYYIDSFKRYPRLSLSEWKLHLKRYRNLQRIKYAIRRLQVDLLIPFTYYPNIIASIFASITSSKIRIWNQRDLGIEGFNGNYYERKNFKLTNYFICNSCSIIPFLTEKGAKKELCHVIENSVENKLPLKSPQEWRTDLGLKTTDCLILKISNIHESKDHLTLVKAFAEISEIYPHAYLILAGKVYDKTAHLIQDVINSKGIATKVLLIGFVEDTRGLLNASDLFAFSSISEGSPNVLLEAAFYNLPIVASKIPSVEEIVGSNYPYLFIPGNSDDCKLKLSAAIDGIKNRNFINKYPQIVNRSPTHIAKKYLEIVGFNE